VIAWQGHPYSGQRYPLPLNLAKDHEFGVLPSPPLAVVDQYVLICTLTGGVEHRVTHLLSHGIPFIIPPHTSRDAAGPFSTGAGATAAQLSCPIQSEARDR
jgi:hypothetical protein